MVDVQVVPGFGGHVVLCENHGLMTNGASGFVIVWSDPAWASWGALGHVASAHPRVEAIPGG